MRIELECGHLAAATVPAPSPVQTRQASSPSVRRAEVLWLLSNMDAAHLTDWQIAQHAGVPPQKMETLRRKALDLRPKVPHIADEPRGLSRLK